MSSYGSIQSLIQRFEDPNEIVNIEDESDYTDNILKHTSGNWYDKYATKKTFSNGLMNGAVLSTNAAQLKTLLTTGFFNIEDPKWCISISLVSSSIFFQVIMLVLSGILANNNIYDKSRSRSMNIVNNIVLVLTGIIFCINIVVNVFVQIDFNNIINNNHTSKPNEEQFFFPTNVPADYWSSSAITPGINN